MDHSGDENYSIFSKRSIKIISNLPNQLKEKNTHLFEQLLNK